MTHSPFVRSFRHSILLILVFVVCGCAGQDEEPQHEHTLSTSEARGFDGICEGWEGVYNLPINYEDPLHFDKSEIVIGNGTQTFKWMGPMSFPFEVPPPDASLETRKELAAKALSEGLSRYNSANGSGKHFAINATEDGFDIVPIQSVNSSGQVDELRPVLDTPITIAPKERSLGSFLVDFTAALSSATGRKILAGMDADAIFRENKTTISARHEPARSVLRRFLKDVPVFYVPDRLKPWRSPENLVPTTLSWQLDCPPDPNIECVFRTRIVAPDGAQAFGKMPPTHGGG